MRLEYRQGDAQLAQSAVCWGRCTWLVGECRIWRKQCLPHTVRVGCRQQEAVDAGYSGCGHWDGQDTDTGRVGMQAKGCLGCRQWNSWDADTGMVWVQAEGCTRIWAVLGMQAAGWLGFRHLDAWDAQMQGEWSPWAPGCRTGAWSCPPSPAHPFGLTASLPWLCPPLSPLSSPSMSVN